MAPSKDMQTPPFAAVMEILTGVTIFPALYVAAKLGLSDLIGQGVKSPAELAKKTDTHAPTLYRVLRSLAAVDLYAEDERGNFDVTEKGKTLQSSHPCTVRDAVIMFGEAWHWRPWGELTYSVRTGKPAFDHAMGATVFEYFGKHPEAGKIFNAAMTNFSNIEGPEIASAYDFSQVKKMVDVAGGAGALLLTVLKANPNLQGTLFDLPEVADEAKQAVAKAGLQGRCEIAAGDFFKSVPGGADLYFMKSIIHDWGDEQSLTILKNCHKAMDKHGKVLLAERVIPPGNTPHFGKFLDLEMLVMTQGGKERTEAEYRKLFEAAGFKLTRIVPTRTPMSLVEGTRI